MREAEKKGTQKAKKKPKVERRKTRKETKENRNRGGGKVALAS